MSGQFDISFSLTVYVYHTAETVVEATAHLFTLVTIIRCFMKQGDTNTDSFSIHSGCPFNIYEVCAGRVGINADELCMHRGYSYRVFWEVKKYFVS